MWPRILFKLHGSTFLAGLALHDTPEKAQRNQHPLSRAKDPQFLSADAIGQVYRINRCIAVKLPVPEGL
jgi:hypothetical protein